MKSYCLESLMDKYLQNITEDG